MMTGEAGEHGGHFGPGNTMRGQTRSAGMGGMRRSSMGRGSMGSDTRRADMNMGRGEMGTPVNSQGICPPGKTLCEDGMCYHDIRNCHSHESMGSERAVQTRTSRTGFSSGMMRSSMSYRRGGGTRGVGRSQRNPKGNSTKRQQLSNRGKTYTK